MNVLNNILLATSCALVGCNGIHDEADPYPGSGDVTCTAVIPAELIVDVTDFVTDEVISTATVIAHGEFYEGNTTDLAYSMETERYSAVLPLDSNLEAGLVVSASGYHTFTSDNLGIYFYSADGCSGTVPYDYSVSLCPLGTTCL